MSGSKPEESDSELLRATNYAGFIVEGKWNPVIMVKGDGMYLEDVEGKKYLDFSAQPACVNLGHNNRRVIAALKDQADKLAYVGVGFGTDARIEFAKKLREVLPSNLTKYFFANSGS